MGVQKPIHLRNRVAVDDMILNGVKPWIVSKEDEKTHLTSLNSMSDGTNRTGKNKNTQISKKDKFKKI